MLHFCRIIIPNWNADILRKLGKNITKKQNKFISLQQEQAKKHR